MIIVPMSDLHGYLPKPEDVPPCDVVCICGDIVPLEYQTDDAASIAWFCLEFVPWTDKLNCKKVLFVAGNHDFFLEHIMLGPVREDGTQKCRSAKEVLKKLLPGNNKGMHKIVYLRDSSFEMEGRRFYGTPWISGLPNWAFYMSEDSLAHGPYASIPHKVDVLLTHMPPNMYDMGTVLQRGCRNFGRNFGSDALAEALENREIYHTFCGHVHSGNHKTWEYKDNCHVTNVSIKDEDYKVNVFRFNTYSI